MTKSSKRTDLTVQFSSSPISPKQHRLQPIADHLVVIANHHAPSQRDNKLKILTPLPKKTKSYLDTSPGGAISKGPTLIKKIE